MKRKIVFILLCVIAMAFPAWAEETTAATTSRVITAGSAADDAAEKTVSDSSESAGPSRVSQTDETVSALEITEEHGTKGRSLGMFTTTGYCTCDKCGGGSGLTYSGTVPKANHTISADISIYPIGTRLMIDDIIYTVEDIGSSVKGNWIDIYYDNHAAAVAHGMKTQEVFAVEP